MKSGGRIGPNLAGIADRNPDELVFGNANVRHTADNYIYLKVLRPEALSQTSMMPTFGFAPIDAAKTRLSPSPASARPISSSCWSAIA